MVDTIEIQHTKYRDMISASVREKLYDVPHRQFVFSVPEMLM